MQPKIPVSVLVVTKNEEKNLPRCLCALESFDEIIVIDSESADSTKEIAKSFGARVENFVWNGQYPKKRQWCLDNLSLKYERIFFVDADEEITSALCAEIASLDWSAAGYFVKGAYVSGEKILRFGLKNNKLCLFDRRTIEFPVVDDLDIGGMGEIEGHYQPVFKTGMAIRTGVLKNVLLHHAMEDSQRYEARHTGYAEWERGMRARSAYPRENQKSRRIMKEIFSMLPFRAVASFAHSYIFLGGFMDGKEGFVHAQSRYRYYKSTEGGDRRTAKRA